MLILVHSSPASLLKDHGRHPNLGVLSGPSRTYMNVDGWPWAADNDAYLSWDPAAYRRMLARIKTIPHCLFVTLPDVVGDHGATLVRCTEWINEVVGVGHPVAFVAQDGATSESVPWDVFDALFIGGTTAWKLGPEPARLAVEAKQRGMWLHMGRVNTRRRLIYAKSIGCDSVDGTNFSMYRQTNLPWALRIAGGPTQLALAAQRGR